MIMVNSTDQRSGWILWLLVRQNINKNKSNKSRELIRRRSSNHTQMIACNEGDFDSTRILMVAFASDNRNHYLLGVLTHYDFNERTAKTCFWRLGY